MKSEAEARATASRGEWLPEPQSNEPYWTFNPGQSTPWMQNGGIIITMQIARGMSAEGYQKLHDQGDKFFPLADCAWEYLCGIVVSFWKASQMACEDFGSQLGKTGEVLQNHLNRFNSGIAELKETQTQAKAKVIDGGVAYEQIRDEIFTNGFAELYAGKTQITQIAHELNIGLKDNMIDEKSIEDNTQKAIDEAEREQAEALHPEKDFPTADEMKKDFKESQQADIEEKFEEGL